MRKYLPLLLLALLLSACGSDRGSGYQNADNAHDHGMAASTTPQEIIPANTMIYNHYYQILKVSEYALFRADGTINQAVLQSLADILNAPELNPLMREPISHWPSGMEYAYSPMTEITAQDFSDFVVEGRWQDGECKSTSGAIVIRLFEKVPESYGVFNGHLTEFTSQWWQLVYRSHEGEEDVLTLWMMQPYRLSPFNGGRFDTLLGRPDERFIDRTGTTTWSNLADEMPNTIFSDACIAEGRATASDSWFFENNYSLGILRNNLLRDFSFILEGFDVENYLVAPRNIPAAWQSSQTQTGTNMRGLFYTTGQFNIHGEDFPGSTEPMDGLGATGLIWGRHRHFALVNGKDGLSIGPFYNHFPHTNLHPTHDDLVWIPSDFEVRTLGHDKDDAQFQTFILDVDNPTSPLTWNYSNTPEEDWRYGTTLHGRSGLWRLNGYDRAFNVYGLGLPRCWETELIWLRSVDALSLANANTVCNAGNRYGYGVNQLAGVRPALHLNLSKLFLHFFI